MKILENLNNTQLAKCFDVIVQLRSNLDIKQFVQCVRVQEEENYHLVAVEKDGEIEAVMGYRYVNNLYLGYHIYVDDLVTNSKTRSKGYGEFLINWISKKAKNESISHIDLDSGVQRFKAHKFYLNNNFEITSHHFLLKIK